MNSFRFLREGSINKETLSKFIELQISLIPIIDDEGKVLRVIDLSKEKSFLPIDVVIMAGGKGTRLRPLTLTTPKPLLKVAGKPIIEYNVDRLNDFGVYNLTISIKYLGQQLIDYFQDGADKDMNISYVEEDEPLGTIGALGLIEAFHNPYILVMNSDLLTNVNYEDLFEALLEKEGEMIVATTAYEVAIPYGVIETEGDRIVALKEKPTYTYYSNAGIYIFKKKHIGLIPKGDHFNATEDGDTKRGVFCNTPAIKNYSINMLNEIVGTFVLVFSVLFFTSGSGSSSKGLLPNIFSKCHLMVVDFADIQSILREAGSAFMGIGKASGDTRAREAATEAINSPLLDIEVDGARGVLFAISGGDDVTMKEVNEIATIITDSIDGNARVIFGTIFDDSLKKGEIKVTVIATGFDSIISKKSASLSPLSRKEKKEEVKEERPVKIAPKKEEVEIEEIDEIDDTDDWSAVPAFLRRGKK